MIAEYSASMGYLTAIMGRDLLQNDKKETRQKILKWLSKLDYWQRHKDLQTRRTPDTGTWVLVTEEFKGWQAGLGVRSLICHGIRIPRDKANCSRSWEVVHYVRFGVVSLIEGLSSWM
jgi:hypothetical protein